MDHRASSPQGHLRALLDRTLRGVNTCLPGEVDSFDAATQTVSVIPAVQWKTWEGGGPAFYDLPKIVRVPLVFPFASTAGFALTLPVRRGDPCLLVFAQAAIDNWHDRGGIQPPETDGPEGRHHSLTDAFALLAPAPIPDVLGEWEAEGIALRNRAGTSKVTVRDAEAVVEVGENILRVGADGEISLTATVSVKVTAPLLEVDAALTTMSGALTVTGAILSETSVADPAGTLTEMRDLYNAHTHPSVSGPDVPSPQME